jgi:hypothetical protein
LITSQWTVVQELETYIKFLKENLDRNLYQIIIKLHPNEDPGNYESIIEPGFVSKTLDDIYQLLGSADIHIGVYSSVLYEAIRYQVANYVLMVEQYDELCRPIIENGIALPLRNDQIPDRHQIPSVPSEYFFAEYIPAVLFDD